MYSKPKILIGKVKYVEEEVSADFGNTLTVSKAQSKPKVTFPEAKAGKLYTLAMIDPDAPSRFVNQ